MKDPRPTNSLCGKGGLQKPTLFKLEIACSLLFSLLNLFCLATEFVIKMAFVDC